MNIHNRHPIIVFLVAAVFFAAVIVFAKDSADQTETVERTQTTVQTEVPVLPEEPVVEEVEEVSEPVEETQQTNTEKQVLNCNNCWLEPVSKQFSLPSSYAPVVEATGLSGGGSLIPEAAGALRDLFSAATADGLSMYVRSAYRSYATQQTTFEKWVGVEMAGGLSRAEAEIEANTYSARPGESEHQLGTTVDLLCTGAGFDSTPCNEEVWRWLANNAADYGFALSYPEGKEAVTGYTFEPWHYRFIGTDNAQAFAAQTSQTLNVWLQNL